jgi:glyoxylase-like metal-dependent hydrolase (beta-lactamase superfamily II)
MLHPLDLQFLGHSETIASFLYETSEGPILIETGPHSTYKELQSELAKKGYTPADIKHVLLTHIHLDHAGAAWAFAREGATIHVHPRGVKHLHDPQKLMDSARRIYKDQMDYLWGQMEGIPMEQLSPMEHGQVLNVGETTIQAWYTPGHAVHHIAWQIGDQLFAGDVAGVKIHEGPVVPPCPPPDIHIEDWQESIRLMRGLDLKTIWMTHFGPIQNITEHLDQLEQHLLDYADWMKPYAEQQADPAKVTPIFQEFVMKELEKLGVEGEDLTRYEYANPPWMSVVGLMRYWKKKWEQA